MTIFFHVYFDKSLRESSHCWFILLFKIYFIVHSSNNFDLVFNRNVQGYAETEFYQDLKAFTVSFWLKVKKEMETGTVMSYSFGDEDCKFPITVFALSNYRPSPISTPLQ